MTFARPSYTSTSKHPHRYESRRPVRQQQFKRSRRQGLKVWWLQRPVGMPPKCGLEIKPIAYHVGHHTTTMTDTCHIQRVHHAVHLHCHEKSCFMQSDYSTASTCLLFASQVIAMTTHFRWLIMGRLRRYVHGYIMASTPSHLGREDRLWAFANEPTR